MRGRTNIDGGGSDVAVVGELKEFEVGEASIERGSFVEIKYALPINQVFVGDEFRVIEKLGNTNKYVAIFQDPDSATSAYCIGVFEWVDNSLYYLDAKISFSAGVNAPYFLEGMLRPTVQILSVSDTRFIILGISRILYYKYENNEISLISETIPYMDSGQIGYVSGKILYTISYPVIANGTSYSNRTIRVTIVYYSITDDNIKYVSNDYSKTITLSNYPKGIGVLSFDIVGRKIVALLSYYTEYNSSATKTLQNNLIVYDPSLSSDYLKIISLDSGSYRDEKGYTDMPRTSMLNDNLVYIRAKKNNVFEEYVYNYETYKRVDVVAPSSIYKYIGNGLSFKKTGTTLPKFSIVKTNEDGTSTETNILSGKQLSSSSNFIKVGITPFIDNSYIITGGSSGYSIISYDDVENTIVEGSYPQKDVCIKYTGKSKAIGFTKQGGTLGEKIKVYLPII